MAKLPCTMQRKFAKLINAYFWLMFQTGICLKNERLFLRPRSMRVKQLYQCRTIFFVEWISAFLLINWRISFHLILGNNMRTVWCRSSQCWHFEFRWGNMIYALVNLVCENVLQAKKKYQRSCYNSSVNISFSLPENLICVVWKIQQPVCLG